MLVLKNPILPFLLFLSLILSPRLVEFAHAQSYKNGADNYMGTITLNIQSQALPSDIMLEKDQSLMVISFGPDLAQRVMDNPIKYANPVRIWLSKSKIAANEGYFYVNKPSHELIFTVKSADLQTLILSGLADFSSTRKNMVFEKGMLYALTIEIDKMPSDMPAQMSAEMPPMDVAMNPKTTYLFEDEQSSDQGLDTMNNRKAKWYQFAWVKPAIKNKYVKWGAGVVAVSAVSYLGYQQFLAPSDGSNLPLPPAPPQ